ncbi:hypothetical protein LSH36_145g06024 [Paralvinella palmiformis]|uniref:Nucleoside-diphosphate kinase n=1 Tax=Paralvinella palmiformis TaxID=53620 RepID=A0AAD9JVB9_9ANNE|nr:hypothetical protein LSH36_145g06024 [Paralvinella palmiformis]
MFRRNLICSRQYFKRLNRNMALPNIVFVLGGPGAGKGTQCALIVKAMRERMDKNPADCNFLIDGFPRNEDNLKGWNRQMEGKHKLQFVLFFDCANDICIKRCLDRGKAGSGRSDDNLDSLKKRIITYNGCTRPIIDYYNKLGLVRQVEASGMPEQVFELVKKHFNAVINKN